MKMMYKKKTTALVIALAVAVAAVFTVTPVQAASIAKVQGLKCASKTTSSVTLKWNKAKGASGYKVCQWKKAFPKKWKKTSKAKYKAYKKNKTTYKVKKAKKKYYFKKKANRWVVVKKCKGAAKTKVAIGKLKKSTNYKFKVRGFKGKKNGPFSVVLKVKTNGTGGISDNGNNNNTSDKAATCPWKVGKTYTFATKSGHKVNVTIKNWLYENDKDYTIVGSTSTGGSFGKTVRYGNTTCYFSEDIHEKYFMTRFLNVDEHNGTWLEVMKGNSEACWTSDGKEPVKGQKDTATSGTIKGTYMGRDDYDPDKDDGHYRYFPYSEKWENGGTIWFKVYDPNGKFICEYYSEDVEEYFDQDNFYFF